MWNVTFIFQVFWILTRNFQKKKILQKKINQSNVRQRGAISCFAGKCGKREPSALWQKTIFHPNCSAECQWTFFYVQRKNFRTSAKKHTNGRPRDPLQKWSRNWVMLARTLFCMNVELTPLLLTLPGGYLFSGRNGNAFWHRTPELNRSIDRALHWVIIPLLFLCQFEQRLFTVPRFSAWNRESGQKTPCARQSNQYQSKVSAALQKITLHSKWSSKTVVF